MREIELSRDKVAIVDDDMFDYLNQWKWHYHNCGYAGRLTSRKLGKRTTILMHRVVIGTPDSMQTDHINHNTLDNRRENLRICTASQNSANIPVPDNNTSGVKGVCWHKGRDKWLARIKYHGRTVHLGSFANLDDAAEAYANSARKYFGEFAYVERE